MKDYDGSKFFKFNLGFNFSAVNAGFLTLKKTTFKQIKKFDRLRRSFLNLINIDFQMYKFIS